MCMTLKPTLLSIQTTTFDNTNSSTTPVSLSVHTGLLASTTFTNNVLPSIISILLPLPIRPVYCGAMSCTSSGFSTSHLVFEIPELVTSVEPSNLSPFDFLATPTTPIINLLVKLAKLTSWKFSGDWLKGFHHGIPSIQPYWVLPTFPVYTNQLPTFLFGCENNWSNCWFNFKWC